MSAPLEWVRAKFEELSARVELALAYARGAGGAVVPRPSWSVPDWYVDPVAGNDANPGTSPSKPVKTIMGGVVAKWGTTRPTLIQNTTIHLLASQPLGQEDVVLEPVVAQGAWFAVVGTPILLATVTLGAVTSKVYGNPGQLLEAAGFPALLGQGLLVVNTTAGKASKCWTFSLGGGGGTATLTQPLAPATPAADASNFPTTLPAEVDTWALGDVVQVFDLPILNLKVWQPAGGDTHASSIGGVAWLQNVHVPDVSGVSGDSYLAFTGTISGCVPWAVDCRLDPYMEILGQSGGGVDGGFAINCWFDGGGELESATAAGGASLTFGFNLASFSSVTGDCVCTSLACSAGDSAFLGKVYCLTEFVEFGGATVKLDDTAYGGAIAWGPAVCSLTDSGTFQRVDGPTWAATLFWAPLTIEGVGTGTSYAAGVWTDGIALTAANLDVHGSLQNPRTGSKFFVNA